MTNLNRAEVRCGRCGRLGRWRHEFCLDCRAVEEAHYWAQWNRQNRKKVTA